ncbi:unnamed protein product [Prunus armeniaca]
MSALYYKITNQLQVKNRGKNYVWLDPSVRGILVIYDPQIPGVSFKQVSTRIPKWKLGQVISQLFCNEVAAVCKSSKAYRFKEKKQQLQGGQLTPFAPMWICHCEQEISNTNANNCKQQKYSNPMMILT